VSKPAVRPDPERILVYGPGGIGKTTFAANAPDVLFVDIEGGSSQLAVSRVEDENGNPPATWEELRAAVRSLIEDPQGARTVVLDTIDRAEWLCWQHVCKGVDGGIEAVGKGYGKGFTAAYEEFRKLFADFEVLWRKRQVRLIFLAHSKLVPVSNPKGLDYQRFTLKVHEKVAGLFVEACDTVLFAHHEMYVKEEEGKKGRGKALGGDGRWISTVEQPTHVAKNRYNLPDLLNLSWDEFAEAVAVGHSPDLLKATILDRAQRLGNGRTKRVEADVAAAGTSVPRLLEIKGRVDGALAAMAEAEVQEGTPEQPAE
jgi:hypothetical protein